MSEKRRHQRVNTNLFIKINHPAFQDGTNRGVAVDLSFSGFAIETEADIAINEVLDCEIEIPFSIKGKVVRRVGGGQMAKYGVRFEGLGFFDKLFLKRVLKGRKRTNKI